ncbi:Putative teichuronic acid biosynthesis glycosyltransferase TuaH [bacterium HR15]|nr:Putative teichuronic acid biosynthesis glycosyltransferase TuaH [bacterium HR15]
MELLHVGHVPFRPESGTPYHLSVALAKHIEVTYINPPLSFAQWMRLRYQPPLQKDSVRVISTVLPGALRFLPRRWRRKPLQALMLSLSLCRLRDVHRKRVILWVSNSELALWLHQRLRPTLTCYHRLDDFGAMDPSLESLEHELEQIADLIFVVSPTLQEQHRLRGRDAILLPNAVNLEFFAKSVDQATPVPSDLRAIPAPRIGFIGWITPRWIDIELLLEVASRRPDWSLVLIGPKVSWHPNHIPRNCYLLGVRPYRQLPAYLKGLDVCLVPFKDNAITQGASPLKLYEYLAAGRAVVSTNVPGLDEFEGIVWRAGDVESFIVAIEDALPLAHDAVAQRRRVEAVSPHSWDARAQTVMAYIRNALGSASISVS